MGRLRSRRSRNCVSAPASSAPSRATRSAARLRETRAREPPSPTIVSGLGTPLLLVALDGLGVPDVRGLGVVARLPERPPLAEEIPGLVETDRKSTRLNSSHIT